MAIDAPGQMAGGPPLSQAWGYGVVLGIGSLFALGMVRIACHGIQSIQFG